MVSSFNIEKLTSLLKDFYTVTQIRITVFDESFREIASWPRERAEICRLIRSNPTACSRCITCDKLACETAARRQDTYVYSCHAGLMEAIMPLRLSNLTIGYLFFGHVFSYPDHETGWKQIRRNCRDYHLSEEELKNACFSSPIVSEPYLLSASHLLCAVANYLCMERMATLRLENLPLQIDHYINTHLSEESPSANSLCRYFQIGKTTLYKIAKESYGLGIAELIRSLRIKKAQELLTENPEIPISQVADLCGFQDYNYFITVFKHLTGLPPKRYAKEAGKTSSVSGQPRKP